MIEHVSIECRKTKTKVVTLVYFGQSNCKDGGNLVNQSKLEVITQSTGKCARVSHDWFWFHFKLVEKVAQEL